MVNGPVAPSDGADRGWKGAPDSGTAMIAPAMASGKERGLTGETLMVRFGRRRKASIPPQQAAAISTTKGTSSALSRAADETGLLVLRVHRCCGLHKQELGRHVLRPQQGRVLIHVGQSIQQTRDTGYILQGCATAHPSGEVDGVGLPPGTVEAHLLGTLSTLSPQSEGWRSVAVQEFTACGDVFQCPLDSVAGDQGATALDLASQAAKHLPCPVMAEGDPHFSQQPIRGFFHADERFFREELKPLSMVRHPGLFPVQESPRN